MDNDQTKTEEQKKSLIDFYQNFEKLVKTAPEGAEFFAMIKAPDGAKAESKGESQITAVKVTGGTLINLFANTFEKAPEVKKSVKHAIMLSEIGGNPLAAFLSMMIAKKEPNFSDIFK